MLIQVSTVEGAKACNILYAADLYRHGWYYEDGFKKDKQFGTYSGSTIARHINQSLGTAFMGISPITMSDDEVNRELIIGKIEPVVSDDQNNLNVIEDEPSDI